MICGLGEPKFTGTGDPDSNTVILYHSTMEPKYQEALLKVFESVLTGHRTLKVKWTHASFTITVNLFDYTTSPTPLEKAKTIYSYLYKDVIFYPFKDGAAYGDGLGKAIKNSSLVNVNCKIIDIQPGELELNSGKDVFVLTVQTNDPYDFSKLMQ